MSWPGKRSTSCRTLSTLREGTRTTSTWLSSLDTLKIRSVGIKNSTPFIYNSISFFYILMNFRPMYCWSPQEVITLCCELTLSHDITLKKTGWSRLAFFPFCTDSNKMWHVGHRCIVDKSSAYVAKGPGFKNQWRKKTYSWICVFLCSVKRIIINKSAPFGANLKKMSRLTCWNLGKTYTTTATRTVYILLLS